MKNILLGVVLLPFCGTCSQVLAQDASFNTVTTTKLSGDPVSLRITGQNSPAWDASARMISYEFEAAGKAQIRSYRGGGWDTYLQFLTSQNTNQGGEPSVRLHIDHAGYIGIGTTSPTSLLELKAPSDYDGTTALRITNNASDYGRANLVLTGRLQNGNDGWAFGTYGRNSIVFAKNTASSGQNIGSIGSEKYSIQLEGNSDALGFLSSQLGSAPAMVLHQNGNIGIGTINPAGKLDVNFSNGEPKGLAIFSSPNNPVNSPVGGIRFSWYANNLAEIQMVRGIGASDGLGLAFLTSASNSNAADERMRISSGGNVSIGTTDAKGYKLAVAGNMIAESVKVKLQGAWPDEVFSEGNKPSPLAEVERFIVENKHLPEIPSAGEVSKTGIDLGDMNARLLKKIEELTLYVIEQDKQRGQDRVLIGKLTERVNSLENKKGKQPR
ncbi:hypothetical protein GS399_05395 [Pedobacter sp. HMF7647]|uniref:Uncharacterized protein n=1 Tax=Hufsiella arboris TaxID=2695275 RepID=A0A7K1Y7I2_9SPHI|nr:hypothetical protein [Hufsiella arboris]MXV50400.1 hypothetical protein [Hufsiella arboris]